MDTIIEQFSSLGLMIRVAPHASAELDSFTVTGLHPVYGAQLTSVYESQAQGPPRSRLEGRT
jgi:hypothetical protein